MKHVLSYLIIVFCFGLFINTDAKADDDLLIICEKGYYQPEIYVRKLTIYEKEKNNSFYSDNRVCNLVISKQKYTEFYNYLISRKRPSDKYYFQTSKSDLETIKEKFRDTIKKIELEKSQKPNSYYIAEILIDKKKQEWSINNIKDLESAVHNQIESESKLFSLYQNYQFSIDDILKPTYFYKTLEPSEGRAYLYQKILLTNDEWEIVITSFELKKSFERDGIPNAFVFELSKLLKKIKNPPSNYQTFYNKNLSPKINQIVKDEKIKTQKNKVKNITKKASDLFDKRSSKIKEINKEKKISYNFKSNTCEPFESKVSFKNIICISKDDVEDLYNGYKLSPFQSFKKDIYDNGKYIQSSILLDMYPEQMKLIINKGCASWSCTKKKAGQNVYKMFVQRTERWHSKYPGDIIKAMSWFEILYLGKLNKSEKMIKRYLNSSTDDYFKAKLDKKELKSLIKMNKGRLQMRKAIGLKRDDDLSKVFETQWALGNYLNKDKRKVKKNIVDPALKKRRVLLMSYKSALKRYKEKVAEIK